MYLKPVGIYYSGMTAYGSGIKTGFAFLVKVRRSETAVTTKQNTDCRIIIQVFIKYRLQKINHSGTGILCSITKLDFYQIPGHSIITDKWMITMALIMKVKGSAFLSAVRIKKSGIQI